MNKQQINPWAWQDALGFSQCWRVDDARSVLFLAGQAPLSADGALVPGDFDTQVRQVFRNIETVLEAAGASLEAVVQLRVYLTDVTNVRAYERVRSTVMSGPPPSSTVLGVTGLAVPGMQVEIEAVAVL